VLGQVLSFCLGTLWQGKIQHTEQQFLLDFLHKTHGELELHRLNFAEIVQQKFEV
jgi:hypothetical protein